MGDICNFSMGIRGKRENIDMFLDMLKPKDTTQIGIGADFEINEMVVWDYEEEEWFCEITGDTNNSLKSALFRTAESMRNNPEKWGFSLREQKELRILRLDEACKELELDIEAFSITLDCRSSEHIVIKDGSVYENTVPAFEDYDEDTGRWHWVGGFKWEFDVLLRDNHQCILERKENDHEI